MERRPVVGFELKSSPSVFGFGYEIHFLWNMIGIIELVT